MLVFPAKYSLSYSFTGFQQSQGDNSFPGTQIDTAQGNAKASVDQIIDFLASVFNTDGTLKNGSVSPDQLAFTIDTSGVAVIDAIATAIAFNATAGLNATTVQAALELLDSKKVDKTQGAYPASAIPIAAITHIASTNVQAALAELRALGPQTGDLRLSIDDTVLSGWVPCNDGTIGDASSSASTLADTSAAALYQLIWNKVADTYAPVTGGRGASAAADFAGHKPIALTKMLGRALAVAGHGTGLSARALGDAMGEETHQLIVAEMPGHTHPANVTDPGHTHSYNNVTGLFSNGSAGNGGGADGVAPINLQSEFTGITVDNGAIGGDGAHNNMQPTAFTVNAFLKL